MLSVLKAAHGERAVRKRNCRRNRLGPSRSLAVIKAVCRRHFLYAVVVADGAGNRRVVCNPLVVGVRAGHAVQRLEQFERGTVAPWVNAVIVNVDSCVFGAVNGLYLYVDCLSAAGIKRAVAKLKDAVFNVTKLVAGAPVVHISVRKAGQKLVARNNVRAVVSSYINAHALQVGVRGRSANRNFSVDGSSGSAWISARFGRSAFHISARVEVCFGRGQSQFRRVFVDVNVKKLMVAGKVSSLVACLAVKAFGRQVALCDFGLPACDFCLVSNVCVVFVILSRKRGSVISGVNRVHSELYGQSFFCASYGKFKFAHAAQSVAHSSVKNHVVLAVAYRGSVGRAIAAACVSVILCLKQRLVSVFLNLEGANPVALVSGLVYRLHVKVVVISHRSRGALWSFNNYLLKAGRSDCVDNAASCVGVGGNGYISAVIAFYRQVARNGDSVFLH